LLLPLGSPLRWCPEQRTAQKMAVS
jgi:hypothetical protein